MSQTVIMLPIALIASANINHLIKLGALLRTAGVTRRSIYKKTGPSRLRRTHAPAATRFVFVNSGTISAISMAAKIVAQPI